MTKAERKLLIAVANAILDTRGGMGHDTFIGPDWKIKESVELALEKVIEE